MEVKIQSKMMRVRGGRQGMKIGEANGILKKEKKRKA